MIQIPGFPNYSVTTEGSIFTKRRKGSPGGALRPTFYSGYYYVCLHKNGKQRTHTVHRLVLETFIGPRPEGMQCRYLDGDSANNKLNNLCWGTQKENEADKVKHGTVCTGGRNGNSLIRREQRKQDGSQQATTH